MKKLFFTLLLCSTTATLHAQHLEPAAAADDDQAYQLVFSDEFDQPDGSAPDPAKWRCSTRYSATWCRWISDSPDVAYIKNGRLVCRAIPNPDTTRDNVPMITGAVETQGKFSFTYGKVEVRLRTNIQNGNFPAAWMMPQPPCDGWPRGGEIDIFESIDNQQRAYHTVHSHWTYDLGHKSDPQHSFSESVKVNEWHVYGLIWTETELRWTLDGNVVATYPKSTDASALQQGQWPFDHPFYIILNQSVGDGSWAKAANTSSDAKGAETRNPSTPLLACASAISPRSSSTLCARRRSQLPLPPRWRNTPTSVLRPTAPFSRSAAITFCGRMFPALSNS